LNWDKEERHFNFEFVDKSCSCDEHCPIKSGISPMEAVFVAFILPAILVFCFWGVVYASGVFDK